VYEEDRDGVPPEEEGGGPGGHDAEEHALGDGLEEDCQRNHRSAHLCPTRNVVNCFLRKNDVM
jgi:hypothetical protein